MLNAFYGPLFFQRRSVTKTLRIMKFTAVILLACCMQVSAEVNSQGITLNVRNAPLNKVFLEIKKQTGYTFMYTETMLRESNKVSIDVKNSTLQEALSICFASQPFTYRIIDKTVILQPKEMTIANNTNSVSLPPPPIEIHGRVVNQQGAPLPNVSVLIVGTNVGTATNGDGRFSLTAPDNKNVALEVSSVGYQTKRVNVGNQTEINITLEVEASGLSDVVVIGYGTAKKGDLTGSVAQVNAETFQNQSMTQLTDMLAGTTAGVYTTQATSAAGGGTIEIRGRTSLTAETDPLIVLDGAIYNGSISDINPNDVESMDILKDASSAAVFGSKAASGVILITTKRGKTGKPIIDFSSKVGVATTTHDLRPFGPKAYLDMHRDFQSQFQSNLPYGYFFHPDELPNGITIDQWRNFSANPAADNIDEWITRINLFPTEI
jgi:TonB-dependent SusC/RagA subfamily outer membrane receptor